MANIEDEFQVLSEMKVPDEYRQNGFIYILANECMPDVYKIGMTTNSPEQRAKEISAATGVPLPFTVVAAFHSANPVSDEQMVHQAWSKERVSQNREFFRFSKAELDDAIIELSSIVGPERNGEVADLAPYDGFISFCRNPEMVLTDELMELGLGGINGHIPAVKNFLMQAGIDYAKRLITEHCCAIVIKPDASVVLVKSADAGYYDTRYPNANG